MNGKTMSLDEFRSALASDATKRADEQSETIQELINTNKELEKQLSENVNELNDTKRDLMHMFNRCRDVHSMDGILCTYCGMIEQCRGFEYAVKIAKKRMAIHH